MENDYELVYLAQENDEIAIEILYKKYHTFIQKTVKKYSRYNRDNEEDFLNEANLSFYNAIKTYKDDNAFVTYLNRCLKSSLLNYYKKINRKKNKFLNEAIYTTENDENNNIVIGDNKYNPEVILIEEEKCSHLKKSIIEKLSWKEELVFQLKIQNYSAKEIAEITDNNLKTVYNILKRIKDKIVKLMS